MNFFEAVEANKTHDVKRITRANQGVLFRAGEMQHCAFSVAEITCEWIKVVKPMTVWIRFSDDDKPRGVFSNEDDATSTVNPMTVRKFVEVIA